MYSLVLEEGDGALFERIYNIAMQLTDPAKAKALSRANASAGPRFWQTAFEEANGDDKALTSAILSAVGVPFGAYTLTGRTPERLEITPWLLSDGERAGELLKRIKSPDMNAETLYSVSRVFSLTADFLKWLDGYTKSAKRG